MNASILYFHIKRSICGSRYKCLHCFYPHLYFYQKLRVSSLREYFLMMMTILLMCMNYIFFSLDYILNVLEKLNFSHTFFRNYLFLWITVNKILLEFLLLYVWSMHVSCLWIVYILSLFHNGYWILLIIQMSYHIVFINYL